MTYEGAAHHVTGESPWFVVVEIPHVHLKRIIDQLVSPNTGSKFLLWATCFGRGTLARHRAAWWLMESQRPSKDALRVWLISSPKFLNPDLQWISMETKAQPCLVIH